MENIKTRVRINLTTREIEWEGTESFVEKQQATIMEFVEKIKADPVKAPALAPLETVSSPVMTRGQVQSNSSNHALEITNSFGEFYTNFDRSAKVVDKILMAGFFAQSKSDDGAFTPKEAADLLDEQNVNVTNTSVFIKLLQSTGKIYKQGAKYKVHENGVEYLKQKLSTQS